jgi:hypothetical protein
MKASRCQIGTIATMSDIIDIRSKVPAYRVADVMVSGTCSGPSAYIGLSAYICTNERLRRSAGLRPAMQWTWRMIERLTNTRTQNRNYW